MSRKTVKAQRRSRRKMSKKQRGGGFLGDCVGALCGSRLTSEQGKAIDTWNTKARNVKDRIIDLGSRLDRLCPGFNIRNKADDLRKLTNLSGQVSTLKHGDYNELLADYANTSDKKVKGQLESMHGSIKKAMGLLEYSAAHAVHLRCTGVDTQGSS